MYRHSLTLKRAALIAGDIVAFQASLALMLWLRYGGWDAAMWNTHAVPFAWVTGLWVLGLFVTGLYDLSKTLNGLAFFRAYLEGMFANLLVAVAFFYLVTVFGIAPRTNLLLYFAIALLVTYLWRLLFNRYSTRGVFRNRLLFIGSAEDALTLRSLLKTNPLGFTLAAVIHTTPRTSHEADGIIWESGLQALERVIAQERIDAIVLGHGLDSHVELQDALYRTLFSPVALVDRRDLEETVTGRVPLDYVGKAWFLEHLRESEKAWFEAAKRAFDVALAIPFGVITILATPIVALIIKLSAPGPVFFRQTRIGRGGKPFTLVKFRTMIANAPDGSAEGQGGAQFTSSAKTDPRLFWAGRLMRQLRIDELPQIWNVFLGDMSFVGPRPERPEFVEPLTSRMPYYALRHLARPALTGWAQVQFLTPTASLDDNLKKLQYDLFYVKHRSFILDAAILLKTIALVVRRQGT
jgi:exopolysaccharide biosynthesis polyprenyl glycosylphosphotransferase